MTAINGNLKQVGDAAPPESSQTELHGYPLLLARTAWLVLVALALLVASLGGYYLVTEPVPDCRLAKWGPLRPIIRSRRRSFCTVA